jgi:hypothetical protein
MPSPKLDFDFLVEGVDGVVLANEALLRLENCLSSVVLDVTNTPPGSPAQGDTYIAGTSPTGAWAGQANKLALYTGSGWAFLTPRSNMLAYVNDDKERWGYDANESLWYPLQPLWKTTEHWTGRYKDGSRVWSKTIDFGALPNTTTKNVAHGITGLILTYKRAPTAEGAASDGTTTYMIPGVLATVFSVDVRIDATNLMIQSNGNTSTLSAFVRLEYCKT